MVKVDSRGRKEIRETLRKRAASYTPEWNMDMDDPDIAAALALACADMFEGTVRKINNLPLKNEIAFFNTIDSSLLSATPSEGYVSFGLSSADVGTTEVPKGTVLSAYAKDGEPVHYETLDEVLVSAAKIKAAFCVDDGLDLIERYGSTESFEQGMFSLPGNNLQTHVLTMDHPYAFHIATEGDLCLCFYQKGGLTLKSNVLGVLADSGNVTIEYYAGEERGYVPFREVHERNGKLYLHKQADMPEIVREGTEHALRFTVRDITKVKNFRYAFAEAMPTGKRIVPEIVYDGNAELGVDSFFPFGERFQIYNEIYIGCGEVLDKRGAVITLSFDLNMIKVPIENQIEDEIQWKWVANKDSFKERTSYEISITEVIWEYYNGYGWSRLFRDGQYSDIFNYTQGVMSSFRSMTFVCPDDIDTAFVGAGGNMFIRARILKADNLYKLRGFFLSPQIRNISFEYYYTERGCRLSDMRTFNCLEEKVCEPGTEFTPFYGTNCKGRSVCLGFPVAPDNGPLRILWDVRENPHAKRTELTWEYLSEKGWKSMNMVDETESFTAEGLTIFLDNHGFARKQLFGEELYWVRIRDEAGVYASGAAMMPVIDGIYYNSVRAVNVDSHKEENFAMNVYSENAEFALSKQGLLDVEVYVNEYPALTGEECRLLQSEGRLREVTDNAGLVTEQWVRWNEVGTFITENGSSRSFITDRSKGTVMFGNGRKGKIPPVSNIDNVKVIYTTGGGKRSNAEPGKIDSMERSIGFVSSVTNPKRFYGGCDTQTVYEALQHSAVMLSTQGKAVTVRDFEELAFAASRSIGKVRCFKGRNLRGEPERGAVTLVVLKDGDCDFCTLRRKLADYMLPRIAGILASSGKFYITEPSFVKMNIKTELAATGLEGIFELKRRAEQCIRECIESYAGREGSNSWLLGRIPNEQQIRSALLRIKRVEFIRNIKITAFVSGAGGYVETDIDKLKEMPYILPVCGESDISISLV